MDTVQLQFSVRESTAQRGSAARDNLRPEGGAVLGMMAAWNETG